MNRKLIFLGIWLGLCFNLSAQNSESSEAPQLWGALIRATNSESSDATRSVSEDLADRLGTSFNFSKFFVVGEHTQPIGKEYHSWVVPSSELFLRVDYKGVVEGGRSLHLQLWQQENVVVKTDVVLKADSPIFFAGPAQGADQLIFVVEMKQ